MRGRIGRPPGNGTARPHVISCRVTKEDKVILQKLANLKKVRVSDLLFEAMKSYIQPVVILD